MAEPSSSYDKLFPTQVFFFVALVMLVNIAVVTLAYSFLLEEPFAPVLQKERDYFETSIGVDASTSMRFTGDSLYDTLFVDTGIERLAYSSLDEDSSDIAGQVLLQSQATGRILDNLFDYLLLLCHRFSFFLVTLGYLAFLIIGILAHASIIRHRKRYEFGDTPILMNLWARSTLSYSLPITFLIWSLPMAMHPMFLISSVVACVFGMLFWSFSMPKIA
jgi:hypothetical protein